MKTSDALLAGFAKVNGEQCYGRLFSGEHDSKPTSCCLVGAANLGARGSALSGHPYIFDDIPKVFGVAPAALNDHHRMDWRDVVGILQSEGL